MRVTLNFSQRKALSSFFINVAVAWFVGAFVTPQIASDFTPLTLIRFLANMLVSLYISLRLLQEER